MSSSSRHLRVKPPKHATWVWVSSMIRSAPCRRVRSREAGVEAVVGMDDADVGHHRLGQHAGDVAVLQRALDHVEVVERHLDGRVARLRAAGRDDRAGWRPGVAAHQRLVDMAVIVAGEDQNLVLSRRAARDAEGLGVGGRGGQRELPHRHAEARAQQPADRDRILGRQQEVAAVGEALGDGARDRRGAEAAHHAEVALRHVEIAVAVDVGEMAPSRAPRNLGAGRRRHPGAGHAVRHQAAALGIERVGARDAGVEARHFLGAQGPQRSISRANGHFMV